MKRTERYTQTETGDPRGDFGKTLINLGDDKYLLFTYNQDALTSMFGLSSPCVASIRLRDDPSSRVKDAREAIIELMPENAEIPKGLSDLLERNKFIPKR